MNFLPYQESLLMKNLGFDSECIGGYSGETLVIATQDGFEDVDCKAPKYTQAFNWFKEHHDLSHASDLDYKGKGFCSIIRLDGEDVGRVIADTYEELQLRCIREFIDILYHKDKIIDAELDPITYRVDEDEGVIILDTKDYTCLSLTAENLIEMYDILNEIKLYEEESNIDNG